MTTANEYTNANFECKYSNVNYCSNVRSGNNTDGHKQIPWNYGEKFRQILKNLVGIVTQHMSQIPTVIGSKKNENINNENSSSNVAVKSRNDING